MDEVKATFSLSAHFPLVGAVGRGRCIAGFVVAIWALTGGGSAVRAADRFLPHFVANEQASLYDGKQRISMKLIPGEIVLAKPHETYRDWLIVRYGNREYSSDGRHYLSAVSARVNAERKIAALEHDLEVLDERIADRLQRAAELFAAETAVRFDYTVQYKTRVLVPVPVQHPQGGRPEVRRPEVPPQNTGKMKPGPDPPPIGLEVRYQYDDKIGAGKSRDLAADWEADRDDLERKVKRLMERRRDQTLELAEKQAELKQMERRLAAFYASPQTYLVEGFITVRRAQLYEGNRLAYELEPDVVLVGTPNRENQEWLRVRYRGGTYDVKADVLRSRFELDREFRRRRAWLTRRIADLVMENRVLAARIDLLDSLQLAVDYESRLNRIPLRCDPLGARLRGNRYYSLRTCPPDAVEIVKRNRARRVWREWDDQLEDLRDKRDANRGRLRKLRRELAGLVPRFEDKLQRLEAASPGREKPGVGRDTRIDW